MQMLYNNLHAQQPHGYWLTGQSTQVGLDTQTTKQTASNESEWRKVA